MKKKFILLTLMQAYALNVFAGPETDKLSQAIKQQNDKIDAASAMAINHQEVEEAVRKIKDSFRSLTEKTRSFITLQKQSQEKIEELLKNNPDDVQLQNLASAYRVEGVIFAERIQDLASIEDSLQWDSAGLSARIESYRQNQEGILSTLCLINEQGLYNEDQGFAEKESSNIKKAAPSDIKPIPAHERLWGQADLQGVHPSIIRSFDINAEHLMWAVDFYSNPQNAQVERFDFVSRRFVDFKQGTLPGLQNLLILGLQSGLTDHPLFSMGKEIKDFTLAEIVQIFSEFVRNPKLKSERVHQKADDALSRISHFFQETVRFFLEHHVNLVQEIEPKKEPGVNLGIMDDNKDISWREAVLAENVRQVNGSQNKVMQHPYFFKASRGVYSLPKVDSKKAIENFLMNFYQKKIDFKKLISVLGVYHDEKKSMTIDDVQNIFFLFKEGEMWFNKIFEEKIAPDLEKVSELLSAHSTVTRVLQEEHVTSDINSLQSFYNASIFFPNNEPHRTELQKLIEKNKRNSRLLPFSAFLLHILKYDKDVSNSIEGLYTRNKISQSNPSLRDALKNSVLNRNAVGSKEALAAKADEDLDCFFDHVCGVKALNKRYLQYQTQYWAVNFLLEKIQEGTENLNFVFNLLKVYSPHIVESVRKHIEYHRNLDMGIDMNDPNDPRNKAFLKTMRDEQLPLIIEEENGLISVFFEFFQSNNEKKLYALQIAENFVEAFEDYKEQVKKLSNEKNPKEKMISYYEGKKKPLIDLERESPRLRLVKVGDLEMLMLPENMSDSTIGSLFPQFASKTVTLFEEFQSFINQQADLQKKDSQISADSIASIGEEQFVQTLVQCARGNNESAEEGMLRPGVLRTEAEQNWITRNKIFRTHRRSCNPTYHFNAGQVIFAGLTQLHHASNTQELYTEQALCFKP